MPLRDQRKAFRRPGHYMSLRGTIWQNRGCSTSGCVSTAHFMIAESANPETTTERRRVRFACPRCKATKYAHLEEVSWTVAEVEA